MGLSEWKTILNVHFTCDATKQDSYRMGEEVKRPRRSSQRWIRVYVWGIRVIDGRIHFQTYLDDTILYLGHIRNAHISGKRKKTYKHRGI